MIQRVKMPSRKLSSLLFVIWFLSFGFLAQASDYDGIWFLGFNFNKSICADKGFRQAVAGAISLEKISKGIMEAKIVPRSIVPPGMDGYIRNDKLQMTNVKLNPKSKIPNKLILLHTDGVKTVKVAKQIKKDLKKIGINLTLKQIDYAKEGAWEKALNSGNYHMFLMGYKEEDGDLLGPLFSSKGIANFCHYKSIMLDKLLRAKKYKETNKILYNNKAAIVLMYITKL